MKKRIILTVMLVCVLALAYSQTPSGTYTYRVGAAATSVTFSGSSFNGNWNRDTPISGTFTVSGTRLMLNITGGPRAQTTWSWTIVDENTLRDQEGDTWTKSGASSSALSGGFGSDSGFSNWFSGEVSVLGAGARFERMLNDKMSIGANLYYNTFIFSYHDLGADFSFRYYPWGGSGQIPEGLFFGGGVGFHMNWFSWTYGIVEYDDLLMFYGGAITPDIGWKLDLGEPGGFFIQPGIKIPIMFGVRNMWSFDPWHNKQSEYKFDVDWSWIPYFGVGYAF
jgi:hypothetical protein